jgi:RNA polymerase sigma factor (sigma-70 family)
MGNESELLKGIDKRILQAVRPFVGRAGSWEDLVQEGRLAALVALRTWRQDAALWTYVRRRVVGRMLDLCGASKRESEVFAPSDAEGHEDNTPESLCAVREILATLEPEEQRLVVGKLVHDMSCAELAETSSLSRASVDRHVRASVEALRGM